MFKANIYVTLKKSIFDPQGKAAENSLVTLGFKNIRNTRIGKFIEIELDENDKNIASEITKEMCEKLLVNFNIETYRFELEEI